jgi:hypothetical protein
MAESFVDGFKTEPTADRVWQTAASWGSRSSSTSAGSTTVAYRNPGDRTHPRLRGTLR